jgi:tRNA dimethylallyltransferase
LVAVGIHWPKDQLSERLAVRARRMYAGGILDEVRACLARGVPPDAPGLSIIGYRDATRHVLGELTLEQAIDATIIATRQYAKRQRNWFRSVQELEWVSKDDPFANVRERLLARLDQGS